MKSSFLALVCAFMALAASAAEVPSLFTAEVPFDRNDPAAREQAYSAALATVLLKVSGPELFMDRDYYDALFPNPEQYVVRFRQGSDDTLFVTFDGEALTAYLRETGQTVWGSERPLTLVWVAVDQGFGDRAIIGATDDEPAPDNDLAPDQPPAVDARQAIRERMLAMAERRGLPLIFPLLDAEDMVLVLPSDIWGGFDEQVLVASQRYDVDSVLIGRVTVGGFELNRWDLYLGDELRGAWGSEPELAMLQVADLLASEFAIRGDEPVRTVDVNVANVVSIEAFGAVMDLVEGISVVDSVTIAEVAGDTLRLRINAVGGAGRLGRALRLAGLLEEERIDTVPEGLPDFDPSGLLVPESLDFYYDP
jgi:hypothetical protein